MNNVAVAKKDNSYMFLITPKFKFLDVKNYLSPGLSLDDWCRANKCQVEKLVFPYEWLDSYDKLSHVGPVPRCEFYSSLNPILPGGRGDFAPLHVFLPPS